ncbi:MAG: flagellar basal body P-ring protein FlgI [Ignavibacteria bacterium]
MKKTCFYLIILILLSPSLIAQRIKDIAYLTGDKSEQIIGYGLVVGLAGTGDTHRSSFTIQSITSMLKRFGITVPQEDLKTRNVAAVMVTASVDSYLKPGAKFDVNVASMGDGTSLLGGTLLMTPLSGINGTVYAFAQGPVSVGGFDINTPSGSRVAKNHSLAGRVPRGGILNEQLSSASNQKALQEVSLFLKEPDLTTSNNIVNAINAAFGEGTSVASDAAEIKIKIPADRQNNIVPFLAQVESIPVETDFTARVVLNERTGTVVAGNNVRIKPVTISHGGLNLTIRSHPIISQPEPFSNGTTVVLQNLIPYAAMDSTSTVAIEGASNVQEVASALNSLKVTPKDIIAIFQALKEAGALVGELVII